MIVMYEDDHWIAQGRGPLRPIIVESNLRIEAIEAFTRIAAAQVSEFIAVDAMCNILQDKPETLH